MAFNPPSSSPSPPAQSGFTVQDKWRLASQLQKAIRHGKADHAAWAVEHLWEVDPNYLRYRLSVIAVEDVGAGSPEVVVDAFAGGWGKKVVDSRGGKGFLQTLASEMASSVKDRLPCDFLACTRFVPEFEQAHGSWEGLSFEDAARIALDRDQPWFMRGLGAWRAAGTKRFASSFLPVVEGDWPQWKAICASMNHTQPILPLMTAGEHQREAHPVFVGLALLERHQAAAQVVSPKLPNLPDIGPWLSAAFDKHTAEGKRAYRHWLATHADTRQWLAGHNLDEAGQLDAVGRLAFWVEGGRCDRQWEYPLAKRVLTETKASYLRRTTLPAQEYAARCADPAGWHQARVWAVPSSPPRPRGP